VMTGRISLMGLNMSILLQKTFRVDSGHLELLHLEHTMISSSSII
jgi:hypothetical protein